MWKDIATEKMINSVDKEKMIILLIIENVFQQQAKLKIS